MPSRRSRIAIGLLAAIASPVAAFWRLPCMGPLVVARMDPIVNPGKISGHLHTIMGGNAFGFDQDYDMTQKSTCSSCKVTKDFSNYWVPQLYYKAKDGTYTMVNQLGGGLIYYLQRTDPKDPEFANGLLAYPAGFRMLAGNPMLRSFSDTNEQKAVNYHCLGTDAPETNGFPQINCPMGLRAQIFFPSCWNGVDLDTADHKSHMAYPSNHDSGFCPPEFPKRFISLFYEVTFDTNPYANMWYDGTNPFVWSMGDPTGYGFHGDFLNGWDVPTLQKAVDECTNLSGVVEDCHVFEFFSDDMASGCKIPNSIDEPIKGPIAALPGCNPLQMGPGVATAYKGCGVTATIGAPQMPYTDLTASKGFQYIGCGIDNFFARSMNEANTRAPGMTNEMCVDFCVSKGYSIAGTEYADECYCGNSFPADKAPIPGDWGNCVMTCAGNDQEFCGGTGAISLYSKCNGNCKNANFMVNGYVAPAAAPSSPAAAVPTYAAPAASSPVPVAPSSKAAAPTNPAPVASSPAAVQSSKAAVASSPAPMASSSVAAPTYPSSPAKSSPAPMATMGSSSPYPTMPMPSVAPPSSIPKASPYMNMSSTYVPPKAASSPVAMPVGSSAAVAPVHYDGTSTVTIPVMTLYVTKTEYVSSLCTPTTTLTRTQTSTAHVTSTVTALSKRSEHVKRHAHGHAHVHEHNY